MFEVLINHDSSKNRQEYNIIDQKKLWFRDFHIRKQSTREAKVDANSFFLTSYV